MNAKKIFLKVNDPSNILYDLRVENMIENNLKNMIEKTRENEKSCFNRTKQTLMIRLKYRSKYILVLMPQGVVNNESMSQYITIPASLSAQDQWSRKIALI